MKNLISFNPEIFKKYLDFLNLTIDKVLVSINEKREKAKRKEINKEDFEKYITEGKIQFSLLKQIAEVLKVNVYSFFRTTIEENQTMVKFKKSNRNLAIDPATYATLRYYDGIRKEIDALEDKSYNLKKSYNLNDKPNEVAEIYRDKFQIEELLNARKRKKPQVLSKKVLKHLWEKIELEEDLYVFKNDQYKKLQQNVRGCIFLGNELPALILLNSAEADNYIITNLLHEFAHYLLGEDDIDVVENFENNKVERWCNQFAYSFMVTRDSEKEYDFTPSNKENLNIHELALKLLVSQASLMIRFHELKIISLEEKNKFFKSGYYPPKQVSKGTPNSNTIKKSKLSPKYLGLVSENYSVNKISKSEVGNYLDIKNYLSIDYFINA